MLYHQVMHDDAWVTLLGHAIVPCKGLLKCALAAFGTLVYRPSIANGTREHTQHYKQLNMCRQTGTQTCATYRQTAQISILIDRQMDGQTHRQTHRQETVWES